MRLCREVAYSEDWFKDCIKEGNVRTDGKGLKVRGPFFIMRIRWLRIKIQRLEGKWEKCDIREVEADGVQRGNVTSFNYSSHIK